MHIISLTKISTFICYLAFVCGIFGFFNWLKVMCRQTKMVIINIARLTYKWNMGIGCAQKRDIRWLVLSSTETMSPQSFNLFRLICIFCKRTSCHLVLLHIYISHEFLLFFFSIFGRTYSLDFIVLLSTMSFILLSTEKIKFSL